MEASNREGSKCPQRPKMLLQLMNVSIYILYFFLLSTLIKYTNVNDGIASFFSHAIMVSFNHVFFVECWNQIVKMKKLPGSSWKVPGGMQIGPKIFFCYFSSNVMYQLHVFLEKWRTYKLTDGKVHLEDLRSRIFGDRLYIYTRDVRGKKS